MANDFKGDANPGKCLKPFTVFSTHDDNDDDFLTYLLALEEASIKRQQLLVTNGQYDKMMGFKVAKFFHQIPPPKVCKNYLKVMFLK